jgi:hypothetical protein
MLNRDDERRLQEIERELVSDDPLLARRLSAFEPGPVVRMPRLWIRWLAGIICTLLAAATLGAGPATSVGIICAATLILTWWIPWLLR